MILLINGAFGVGKTTVARLLTQKFRRAVLYDPEHVGVILRLLGSKHTDLLEDEWTVATVDGSFAAHFEHTFTVTPQGAWVLTAVDGGRARLDALGVPFGGR
jgi:methionine aminopeptidase